MTLPTCTSSLLRAVFSLLTEELLRRMGLPRTVDPLLLLAVCTVKAILALLPPSPLSATTLAMLITNLTLISSNRIFIILPLLRCRRRTKHSNNRIQPFRCRS